MELPHLRAITGSVSGPDGRAVTGGTLMLASDPGSRASCVDVVGGTGAGDSLVGFSQLLLADDRSVQAIALDARGGFRATLRVDLAGVAWLEHDALWCSLQPIPVGDDDVQLAIAAAAREPLLVQLVDERGAPGDVTGARAWQAPILNSFDFLPPARQIAELMVEQLGEGRVAIQPRWHDGGAVALWVPGFRLEGGALDRSQWSEPRVLEPVGVLAGRLVTDDGAPVVGAVLTAVPRSRPKYERGGDHDPATVAEWGMVTLMATHAELGGPAAPAVTDADGRFVLRHGWPFTESPWMSISMPDGSLTWGSAQIQVVPGSMARDVDLGDVIVGVAAWGRLAVRVVDGDGTPVPGGRVHLWDADTDPWRTARDRFGFPAREVLGEPPPLAWCQAITDRDGSVPIASVHAGQRFVELLDDALERIVRVEVLVPPDDSVDVVLVRPAEGD